MEKTFTYTKITNDRYNSMRDEFEQEGYDIEYTAYDDEIEEAVVDIAMDYYFKDLYKLDIPTSAYTIIRKGLTNFIMDSDHWQDIVEELADAFEKELKDYFEEVAFEQFD